MKIAGLITILLVLIALASCSQASPSISIVLPTPPPTPFVGPNLADSQGLRMTEMRDAQGRLIMERQADGRSRFYIYEDGYDTNVGNGLLMLKAEYNYTFDMYGNRVQVEIRQTSNDELIGYWLEIPGYDTATGAFLGIEIPITIIDSNGDRLISIQELEAALTALGEEVKTIAVSQPDYARKFQTDITTAKTAIDNGAISEAYHTIKQLQIELAYVQQASQAAKGAGTGLYRTMAVAAVLLFVAGFVLVCRRRPGGRVQHANTTSTIVKNVRKNSKNLESKSGGTEQRRTRGEYETERHSVQRAVQVTVCPNCKMRVLPRADGTCPSCQSKIM